MERLHIVIMAGGAGTRFWPRSRSSRPKQFLPLVGDRTLLAETALRCDGLCPRQNIWISTREDLVETALASLPDGWQPRVIAEPEGRDTAPALVLAAAHVAAVDPEAWLLVLPADHRIDDAECFRGCVIDAIAALERHDGLMTFGVKPTYPATGYGYIRIRPGQARTSGSLTVHPVVGFHEKPQRPRAEAYLAAGDCLWNAGIFLWRVDTFRRALAQHAPDLAAGWGRLESWIGRDGAEGEVADQFRRLRAISIDYALLELAQSVFVAEARFSWDDLGSWRSVETHRPADPDGNVTDGDTALLDCHDTTVLAIEGRLIAVLGVDGLAVIDSPDALLVCPRDRVEEVKQLVEHLRANGQQRFL
ncbi:MAG: mannose-1-phosphate guanylyltransferase [Planctomycetota bacterium]